jgi:hypothetical protein
MQGDNLMLCLPRHELRADTELAAHGAKEAWHAAAARRAGQAAFWRQWNLGKPVLVTDVHGEMTWTPRVCSL